VSKNFVWSFLFFVLKHNNFITVSINLWTAWSNSQVRHRTLFWDYY